MAGTGRRGRVGAVVLTLGLIAAAAGAALLGLDRARPAIQPSPEPERPPVVVTAEPVTARAIVRTVSAVGSLWGWDEVPVSAKVEGRVVRVHRDVGDVVKPGDPLIDLDPTDYELAVAAARRALELELARLGLRDLPPPGAFDAAAVPTVIRAAAQERAAASRRDRIAKVAGGAASTEEREQAQADYEVARANHRQAVIEAEATVASARYRQAAVETLTQKIKDTHVTAPPASPESADTSSLATRIGSPVEYVVCQRSVAAGEMVRVGPAGNTVLFKLVIDRPLKLMALVPERFRDAVRLHQPADLEVEAYPGRRFSGRVSRVNPSVDRASRTFQVEVAVPNEQRLLSAGSFAKVAIQTGTDPAARTVPEEAVVRFAGVTKVFEIRQGRARAVPVRTGASLPVEEGGRVRTWVEVQGGLAVGARVVTSGQSQLADGSAAQERQARRE